MASYSRDISLLFSICSLLRRDFTQIEREADHVKEISMNASVAAGQTGSHMRVCVEIANQVSMTASRMVTKISEVRTEVNLISNLTLQALIIESRLRRYEEARVNVAGKSNKLLVQSVMTKYQQDIAEVASSIRNSFHKMESKLKALSQLQIRLFACHKALHIEAVGIYGTQFNVIMALADSLSLACDDGLSMIHLVNGTLREVHYLVGKISSQTHRETVYAEVRVA